MSNSERARVVPDEDGVRQYLSENKVVSVPLAFGLVVVVSAVLVDVLFSSEIAAIILAWGLYMFAIVVVFAVLPYYAIGLLGYRER